MSRRHRRRPSAAMIVAVIAVVIATTGNAFAGQVGRFAKQLINGSSIKPHSIHGRQIAKNTLTGKQINESKLGTVPGSSTASVVPRRGATSSRRSCCAGAPR